MGRLSEEAASLKHANRNLTTQVEVLGQSLEAMKSFVDTSGKVRSCLCLCFCHDLPRSEGCDSNATQVWPQQVTLVEWGVFEGESAVADSAAFGRDARSLESAKHGRVSIPSHLD